MYCSIKMFCYFRWQQTRIISVIEMNYELISERVIICHRHILKYFLSLILYNEYVFHCLNSIREIEWYRKILGVHLD